MPTPDDLRVEYEQVNENFRALADIRFRLVALVPTAGVVAAYVLARLAERSPDHAIVLWISMLGFVATLGLTFYDLRNSHLYNALSDRAKALEQQMGLASGQFSSRPQRSRRLLFFRVGHDPGLALIYAPVLGAWFYPGVFAAATILGAAGPVRSWAFAVSAIVTLLFLAEFLRLDGVWQRLLNEKKSSSAA